jgi:intracellular sulfur oxidation DsrE/DsrF family protein
VDQAARLDALDIVDVKICQTMMKIAGVERDDIPSFIEQVPLGSAEVDRLVEEGYVYF